MDSIFCRRMLLHLKFNYFFRSEMEELYPNKFLHLSDKRVYVLNTLFNLPETFLIACLVNYFDGSKDYQL